MERKFFEANNRKVDDLLLLFRCIFKLIIFLYGWSLCSLHLLSNAGVRTYCNGWWCRRGKRMKLYHDLWLMHPAMFCSMNFIFFFFFFIKVSGFNNVIIVRPLFSVNLFLLTFYFILTMDRIGKIKRSSLNCSSQKKKRNRTYVDQSWEVNWFTWNILKFLYAENSLRRKNFFHFHTKLLISLKDIFFFFFSKQFSK